MKFRFEKNVLALLEGSIDIHIQLSKRMTPYSDEELKFMIDDLNIKLREQSTNLLPYRIFVK